MIFASDQFDCNVILPLLIRGTFEKILITKFSMKYTYFSKNMNGLDCSIVLCLEKTVLESSIPKSG